MNILISTHRFRDNREKQIAFVRIKIFFFIFQAKKDIYNVKSQRLVLAQDEYDHLNNALTALNASRTSCKYISSFFLLVKFQPHKSTNICFVSLMSHLDLEIFKNQIIFFQYALRQAASALNMTPIY